MEMEDKEIIAKMIAKDFQGLEGLIDQYGFAICQTICKVLNHPAEVSYRKEVENEIFYKIWSNSPLFDSTKASLKTWCLTITRNLAVDKKRQVIRHLREVPSEILPEGLEWEQQLGKEEFLELVAILNPEDQMIFFKYFFFQDKPGEIAEDLGLDVAVVSNRLARGKKKLRNVLRKAGQS